MKKVISSTYLVRQLAFIFFLANFGVVSCQTSQLKTSSIPDSLNTLFHKSCASCHSNKGELYSKSMLNFDKWQDYSDSKKAEKAAMICSQLTKGTMPPKMVRDTRPDLVPTKEQTSMICKWAELVKTVTQGK